MALDKKQLAGEYQEPKNETTAEDRKYYEQLRESMEASFAGIGVYINEPGFEKSKSGSPRIYELTEDGKFKNALEYGADMKSDTFLDKLSQGRIFTFPSGELHASQVTVSEGRMQFSRTLGSIPASPAPKEPQKPQPMGRWARFANWITGGRAYKKERADYNASMDQYRKDREQYTKDMEKHQKQTETQKNFKETVLGGRNSEDTAADMEREHAGEMLRENPTYSIDQYRNTLKECYGPKPVLHKEFCQEYGGQSYHQAEFEVLQDYSGSVEGAGISDEEFTAISLFNALDPEVGGKYDPEQNVGLTPEEVVFTNVSMLTDTVNAEKVTSRPSHGKVYGQVIQPAREKTVEAIREYKQGNPEKLAQQIGWGLHTLSNHYSGKPIDKELFLSTTSMMGDAMKLLDRDPKLKAETERAMTSMAAKDHPDASPEELKAQVTRSFDLANGQNRVLDLTRKNEKAQGMLKAESLGLCTLTAEQRKGYIDDRLAFETLKEDTANDIYAQQHSQAYQAEEAEQNGKVAAATMSGDPVQMNKASAAYQRFVEDYTHAPETVVLMGSGKLTPDKLVEARIPSKDKLYELSGAELENALEAKNLLSEKSPYTRQPEQQKEAPQKSVEKAPKEQVKDQDMTL